MNYVKIHFLALTNSKVLEINSESPIDELVNDLLKIFTKENVPEDPRIVIEALQQCTAEVRDHIDAVVEKYKHREPRLNQVTAYFKKLEVNESFFVVPANHIPSETSRHLFNFLAAIKRGENPEQFQAQHDVLFKEFLSHYDILSFGEKTTRSIGEPDKLKRTCRFCGRMVPETTFNGKAHAVSEALGNKSIVANEECDNCNSNFGSGIENDLIHYLDLVRCVFGIKGKNGPPKIIGQKFELSRSESLVLKYIDDIGNASFPDSPIKLETNNTVNMQNIYKSLCKYALSVISTSELDALEETVRWIRGLVEISNLPKIAILNSYRLFSLHPQLTIYVRKSDNIDIPHIVCELRFTYLTFVYLLPLSAKDKRTFTEEKEYNIFWQYFKHYNAIPEWSFQTFDDNISRRLVFEINFQKGE